MNTRTPRAPVIVVGGGIGGLAAAFSLATQAGWPVQVFEQAAEFKEIGAGIQLGPNVFKMFDRLGLIEEIRTLAAFPDALVMMDSTTSEEVVRIPVGDGFRARFDYPYALIHRADLHRVLLDACRRTPGIQLHAGTKIVDTSDQGDAVCVRAADGETFTGAALVAADGLWSTTRAQLVADGKPRVSGHIAYRAVLPTREFPERFRRNEMVLWAGPKNHLVHYPLRRGDLYNLVAVFHSARYDEGWDAYGDPNELRERFSQTCETVRTLLGKIQDWRMWVLCDREPVKEWSKGRMTLLGDAAHPMLQYLAQGACMAIEDAVVLADQVAAAAGDFEAAFRNYRNARYLRTGRCQIMARVYGEFYHATGVTRELRNQMLAARSVDDSYEGMAWLYDGI